MEDNSIMNPDQSQRPREGDFGDQHWTEMTQNYGSGNTHTTPVHEYPTYQFGSSPGIEPAYSMPLPPPYTSHQQLQPLVMPQWPSMLASPSSYTPTPLTAATASTPISASSTSPVQNLPMPQPIPPPVPVTTTGSTPRRTLTDADRKAMCLFHQQNPHVKQTEIGSIFGVERSTVSKVLRLKDKFLSQDEGSQSPVKKSKHKSPDIDRGLLNWIRKQQKHGKTINDALIREKARQFALSVGNDELQRKINTPSWLERFKSKNNIGIPTSRIKQPSKADTEVNTGDGSPSSSSNTPSGVSPVSPSRSGIVSPPMSPSEGDHALKVESNDGFFDFVDKDRDGHAAYSDALPSLPASVTSPISPFWPESSTAEVFSPPISAAERFSLPGGPPALRPRSQTFPNLNLEPGALLNSTLPEESTPKYSDRTMSFELFESPLEDSPISVNPLATMKRNNSMPNVHGDRLTMDVPPIPPLPKKEDHTPTSPTQDDARKALEVIMAFFQSQPDIKVDPQDFVSIGRLMEKLELAQSPNLGHLPGGFHRVERHEDESPRMRKKRSIRSL